MVTIKYNGVTVSVPENWDDITLGLYETFSTDIPETTRERVAWVARICMVDAELLLSWPAEIFNTIVDCMGFLFTDNPAASDPTLEIDGVTYVVPVEDKLSLGAWIDAEEVQKKGENVISNILAIVCRPVGEEYNYENNEKRAAMFAALPVSKVLGVLAFFLHYSNVLHRRTQSYINLVELVDRLPRNILLSRVRGGGIKLSLIWPAIKYYALTISLRYHLRRRSTSFYTKGIRKERKKRKEN